MDTGQRPLCSESPAVTYNFHQTAKRKCIYGEAPPQIQKRVFDPSMHAPIYRSRERRDLEDLGRKERAESELGILGSQVKRPNRYTMSPLSMN